MALHTVNTGDTIANTDVDQLVNIPQVPSGQQEIGHYFLAGGVYANNAVVSCSIRTLNHFSSPTAVAVDTTDLAPAGGMGTVAIGNQTTDSCQIFCTNCTGPNVNAHAGGKYTITY